MEQPYMLPMLDWQFHVCWSSDDLRIQDIIRNVIDPQGRNIPSPASEELSGVIYKHDAIMVRKSFRLTDTFVRGKHRLLVHFPHKVSVMQRFGVL